MEIKWEKGMQKIALKRLRLKELGNCYGQIGTIWDVSQDYLQNNNTYKVIC